MCRKTKPNQTIELSDLRFKLTNLQPNIHDLLSYSLNSPISLKNNSIFKYVFAFIVYWFYSNINGIKR